MRNTDDLFVEPEENSYDFRERYLRIVDGYRMYRIVRAALDAGLFNYMDTLASAEDIARMAGTDPGMTGLVCDALVKAGFVENVGGMYRNTDSSRLYLSSLSGLSMKGTYDMIHKGLEAWDHVDEALRDGCFPIPEAPDRFYHSMTAFGEFSKGGFISALMNFIEDEWMVRGSKLLDVAGGHGLYSVAIASRYPGVEVHYFDRDVGARVAEDNFRKYGYDIPIHTGDYYAGDIPGTYNILVSSFNDSACKPELVSKIAGAVRPGGLVILRRYVIEVNDPIERVIQANIVRPKGSELRSGHRGQPPEERAEFERATAEYGFVPIKRESTDDGTEMIAYRVN